MRKYVVFDIDGTVAEMGDRKKYLLSKPIDWEAFYEDQFDDKVIAPIAKLVSIMKDSGHDIVFCTGRKEKARGKTSAWIHRHLNAHNMMLLMRADDDNRSDDVAKPELLAAHGLSPENVLFIVEDRARVVKKWRELGFMCLQCADGDF